MMGLTSKPQGVHVLKYKLNEAIFLIIRERVLAQNPFMRVSQTFEIVVT